jgi:hypothetical protein
VPDNLTTQAGSGGPDIATNEIGGVHYARSKIGWGAPGVYNDADAANPIPFTAAQLTLLVEAIRATNSVFTDGDKGLFILGKRRDADTTLVGDSDYCGFNFDSVGRLKVASQPGDYLSASGNITASGQTVSLDVSRISNLTISLVATGLSGHNATFEYSPNSTNGTDGNWYGIQAVRTNANTTETTTGVLAATPAYGWECSVNAYKWVRIRATAHTGGTANYILQPGTYATEPIPAIQTHPVTGSGNFNMVGPGAHSAAASGNPVQVGGVVATAVSTGEAAGETCRLAMTTGGQALVKPYGLPETDWQYAAAAGGIINTTDVVARAAGAAGVRNYVTGLSLSNNSATATEFVIKDGATVIWRGHCPANMPNMHYPFPTPLRGTAATAINIACITTAAAVYANLQGYQAP